MMLRELVKLWFFMGLCLTSMTCGASKPVWTLTPLSPTTVLVPINGSATVDYLVTNQSRKPHTLMLFPMSGVQQVTEPGYCANPFLLTASSPSCTLRLEILGSTLNSPIVGGPVVCQQGEDGRLSELQCYQPSPSDTLNVRRFSTGSFAYVTDNQEAVARCPIISDGSLGTCVDSGNSGVVFQSLLGIAMNNDNTASYIASFSSDSAYFCPIDADGSYGACQIAAPSGFNFRTNDLSLTQDGSTAYLAVNDGSDVYKCSINPSTGLFDACTIAGNVGNRQLSVPINNHISPNKLYASLADKGISTCIINPDKTLSGCTVFDSPDFINLSGMAVNHTGSFLYVLDIEGEQIFRCALNAADGAIDNCVTTGPSLNFNNNRSYIAINKAGTKAYISVPDESDSYIAVCTINADGTLSNTCLHETGGTLSRPYGIGLAERS